MKPIWLAALLMATVGVPLPAEKKALTFDDFFSARRITGFVVSRDGRAIAFAVKIPDIAANSIGSDIFLTDIHGRAPRRLTDARGNSTHPQFLTEQRLTFLSTRDGEAQVYALDIREPDTIEQLTKIPGGGGDFSWTPGAKAMVFQKEVFPAAATLPESVNWENERNASPVKAKILSTLLFRQWNSWRDGKRSHLFLHTPGSNDYQDLTPGDTDTPPIDLGGGRDYGFSSDGRTFAYVKNTDPMVAISTNNDVFVRDLAGNSEENITAANAGNDAGPLFSPRNRFLAYFSMKRAGFESDKKDLILYDLKNRSRRNLTAAFPYSVNEYVFSPDEKAIYFIAGEGVHYPIFRLDLRSGAIAKLVDGVYASALAVTPDGKHLLFLSQSVRRPNEIFKFEIRSRKPSQITDLSGEHFRDIEMPPAETFTFNGAKDEPVEGILLKPPFFDAAKKYPLLLIIHGGPQGIEGDEFHYRWNLSMFAAPGYVVAGINFHGSTGYGQPFCDAITKDWGGAPFIDIVKGQQYLVEHFPFIDKERIAAAGASYGGFMINWIAGHSDAFAYPFRSLVSHDGTFDARSMYYSTEELWFEEWEKGGTPWTSDLYEKFNPANFVSRFHIPMLVVHSENDFRIPVTQGLMLFTALQRQGVESKMLYFPDEDHFVQKPQNARLWWRTVLGWIAEHFK